jgi:hypothetical protein
LKPWKSPVTARGDDLDEPSGGAQRLQRAADCRTHRGLRALDADDPSVRGGAGRARQELFGRRRPQLDEAAPPARSRKNLQDARKLAGMLRTWPK